MSNIGIVDIKSQSIGSDSTFWCSIQNEQQTFICRHPTANLAPYNTCIRVDNIFGSYPVRRKCLIESAGKAVETIKTQLQIRLLGYPEVALQLISGSSDTLLCSYAATQSINQRVAQVYGPATAQTLDFVSIDYGTYSLCGSISCVPILARIQHIFINGRLHDDIELLDTVRSALCTNDYMAKTNVSARSNESLIRSSRAKHPMFVLLIRSKNDNFVSAGAGSNGSSRISSAAPDIKRLLVLACIKFLRKLGMTTDSHMQKLTSQADILSKSGHQPSADYSSYSRKRRGSPLHEIRKQFPIRFGSRSADSGSAQSQPLSCKPVVARDAPIPSVCLDLQSVMASTGQDESDWPVSINSLQVIGQADEKYIMCRCDSWLIAIDQHAADERIRLEGFFDDLCKMLLQIAQLPPNCPVSTVAGVSVLMPSVTVALNEHDSTVIRGLSAELRLLGIQFASQTSADIYQEETESYKIHIVCAPTVLVPRLASRSRGRGGEGGGGSFGKNFLLSATNWIVDHSRALGTRGDYARFSSDGSSGRTADLARAWPALASQPPVLVETARSVACSGAIKFNQALSKDECQLTVDRLAECKFPRFCAHGRRSVARVARLEPSG
ncbi:DNA mismatch repair protein [Coemansia guatemalensis]|uniref:DNA mismatch repair protein n=1 Tax=Coemansia guatemalensis TaxID=2761395 RepID=A0A9W8HUN5_9FUNG|nr:DNA mismatch repair protein [Coemansia guatemalensis]